MVINYSLVKLQISTLITDNLRTIIVHIRHILGDSLVTLKVTGVESFLFSNFIRVYFQFSPELLTKCVNSNKLG